MKLITHFYLYFGVKILWCVYLQTLGIYNHDSVPAVFYNNLTLEDFPSP